MKGVSAFKQNRLGVIPVAELFLNEGTWNW
jgi:hypothetical protein